MADTNSRRFDLVDMSNVAGTPCPCGIARRAFTDDVDQVASFHVVEISESAKTHYHKTMTEFYYVLEGSGSIELDGESFNVQPGSAVMIKPGCRHRAVGKMKIINVPVPAFDPNDEWFD